MKLFFTEDPLLKLFLALDVARCPGDSFQSLLWNGLPAIYALSIGFLLDTLKCLLYIGEQSLFIGKDRLLFLGFQKVDGNILKLLRALSTLDGTNWRRVCLSQACYLTL